VNEPDLSDGHGLMNIITFHGLQAGSGKILPATYCPLISPADETLSRLHVQFQNKTFHLNGPIYR
jgi:hypothetical protein